MAWGTRHDGDEPAEADWDLTEGRLRMDAGAAAGPRKGPRTHGPSGESWGDDGAGNPLPREADPAYGAADPEAGEMPDDWTRVDSDEFRL